MATKKTASTRKKATPEAPGINPATGQDMAELGASGGIKVKRKYGKKHFAELARKSWANRDPKKKGGRPPAKKKAAAKKSRTRTAKKV